MKTAVVGNESKCQTQTMQMINGPLQSLRDANIHSVSMSKTSHKYLPASIVC